MFRSQNNTFKYTLMDLLCNHNNGDIFTCENNVFFTCEDIMLSRESLLGISLVFMYNKGIFYT